MLRVRDLKKSYGARQVVAGVSFDVNEGEIVGLLGPNGAGKTTTFRMTMGIVMPDSGTVELCGRDGTWRDVGSSPMHARARAGMGYLPQEQSVFRDLTVEQNLDCILETLSLTRAERRARRDAAIDEYGLGKVRKSIAGRLSGGEKKRLEIARALLTQPRIMLLDEPFAAVDPIAVGDIKKIVYGLRERGIAVLITDHNHREMLTATERIYLMAEGRMLVTGTPREIANNPDAKRVYLGEDFTIDLPQEEPTVAPPGGAS